MRQPAVKLEREKRRKENEKRKRGRRKIPLKKTLRLSESKEHIWQLLIFWKREHHF